MANVARIEQELVKAEKELKEAKTVLQEFKDGEAQGKLLERLRLKLADGEGTEAQQRRWEKTVDDLAAKEKRLDESKTYWEKQVGELQLRVTAATQPGNDFVTRALGTRVVDK